MKRKALTRMKIHCRGFNAPFLMVWVVHAEPVFCLQLFPATQLKVSHQSKPSLARTPQSPADVDLVHHLSAPVACSKSAGVSAPVENPCRPVQRLEMAGRAGLQTACSCTTYEHPICARSEAKLTAAQPQALLSSPV